MKATDMLFSKEHWCDGCSCNVAECLVKDECKGYEICEAKKTKTADYCKEGYLNIVNEELEEIRQ